MLLRLISPHFYYENFQIFREMERTVQGRTPSLDLQWKFCTICCISCLSILEGIWSHVGGELTFMERLLYTRNQAEHCTYAVLCACPFIH